MGFPKTSLLTVGVLALAVAGCQSERFGPSNPAPLRPAPLPPVQQSQLPAPGATTDPSAFPEAPGQTVEQAALDPSIAAAAPVITKNTVVGSWKATSAGATCQMFMTLTKYGNASRGGTRGCSGDLANMRGWDVKGKQLVIYDDGGNSIAQLYSSGAQRFDGQTSSGQAVSVFR